MLDWQKERGLYLDPKVKPVLGEYGWSFRAVEDIKNHTTLVKIERENQINIENAFETIKAKVLSIIFDLM